MRIHQGYIEVYLPKHRLAACDGYVLEHRLVAENMIGRKLKPKEVVHHKNGNRSDNRECNLEILKSTSHHCFVHRKLNVSTKVIRRHPDQRNVTISCACGCGERFKKFHRNMERKFKQGHSTIPKTQNLVLKLINKLKKSISCKEIQQKTKHSRASLNAALLRLNKAKKIKRIKMGFYKKYE